MVGVMQSQVVRVARLLAAALVTACGQQDGTAPVLPGHGGVVRWVAAGGTVSGQPGADSTTVYFGTLDHQLHAVRRSDGVERWSAATDARKSGGTSNGLNVLVAQGEVIFGDYVVYAFDAATGARRWVFDPQAMGIAGYGPGAFELRTDSTRVYAGSGSGHAYAIDLASGQLVWEDTLATDGNTSVLDPVLCGTTVYLSVRHFTNPTSGALVAADARTGRVLWTHTFLADRQGSSSAPQPRLVCSGALVIAAVMDGTIHALDASTGAEQWVVPRLPAVMAYDDERDLALVAGTVVAGSDAPAVTGYDPVTGHQAWQVDPGVGAVSNPIATDGVTAYVTSVNGALIAVDGRTGKIQWQRPAPKGFFLPQPLAVAEAVFAPSSTGLVALTK